MSDFEKLFNYYGSNQEALEFLNQGQRTMKAKDLYELLSILESKKKEFGATELNLLQSLNNKINNELKEILEIHKSQYLFASPKYYINGREYDVELLYIDTVGSDGRGSNLIGSVLRSQSSYQGGFSLNSRSKSILYDLRIYPHEKSDYTKLYIIDATLVPPIRRKNLDEPKRCKYAYIVEIKVKEEKDRGKGYGRDMRDIVEKIAKDSQCDFIIGEIVGESHAIKERIVASKLKRGYNLYPRGSTYIGVKYLTQRGKDFLILDKEV